MEISPPWTRALSPAQELGLSLCLSVCIQFARETRAVFNNVFRQGGICPIYAHHHHSSAFKATALYCLKSVDILTDPPYNCVSAPNYSD